MLIALSSAPTAGFRDARRSRLVGVFQGSERMDQANFAGSHHYLSLERSHLALEGCGPLQ